MRSKWILKSPVCYCVLLYRGARRKYTKPLFLPSTQQNEVSLFWISSLLLFSQSFGKKIRIRSNIKNKLWSNTKQRVVFVWVFTLQFFDFKHKSSKIFDVHYLDIFFFQCLKYIEIFYSFVMHDTDSGDVLVIHQLFLILNYLLIKFRTLSNKIISYVSHISN